MLMTQTAVSALQGQQNTTSSFNSRKKDSTADQAGPAAQQQLRIDTSGRSASLDHSNAGRVDSAYATHSQSYSPYLMNGIAGTAPAGTMYVRALYDYEADDRTSLSFHEGDTIQVITQLESGWWDGVINGVRGWFPSNYCQIIPEGELTRTMQNGDVDHVEEDVEEQDAYDESFEEEEEGSDHDDTSGLPLEGTNGGDKSRADFWIPQATPDGRLFYYNTMTGESSMELPLESPTSVNETGPRDRMNANIPEKTRPPAEMMARGLTQDEDEDSDPNSASEAEGDPMMASRGSLVRHIFTSLLMPRVISH